MNQQLKNKKQIEELREQGYVVLTMEEYEYLERIEAWSDCLDSAGLDNWLGCEHASELMKEMGYE